jgi:hypothetical protein
MVSQSYAALVVIYSFVSYFAMHRSSHLAYLGSDPRVRLNPALVLLMRVEQLAGLGVLVWYGYHTVWYYPLILVVIGFAGTFILKAVEHLMNLHRVAWAISIFGIFAIPVLLCLMVLQINRMTIPA